MYIYNVSEIEQIIFSYLDKVFDLNKLRFVNRYYKKIIIHTVINLDLSPERQFVDACEIGDLFLAKYFYYGNPIDSYKDHAFAVSCENNHLTVAKWLLTLNNIDINIYENYAFVSACKSGHLEIAKWLFEMGGNIDKITKDMFFDIYTKDNLEMAQWLYELYKFDIHNFNKSIFNAACSLIGLNVAQWLLTIDKDFDIHANDEQLFRTVCKFCPFDKVKWLYDFDRKINIRAHNDNAFVMACNGGNMQTAKWLLELDNNINVRTRNDAAFRKACCGGHLDVAKWLFELSDQDIDIHVDDDNIFVNACICGHLDLAKWLFEMGNVDVNSHDEDAFYHSCLNGYIDITKWLFELDSKLSEHNNFGFRYHNDFLFEQACLHNRIDIAKMVIELDEYNDITLHVRDKAFIYSCHEGHLHIAKWLFGLKVRVLELAFNKACERGHFDVVKWLSEQEGINIHDADVFIDHCAHNLDLMKWLYNNGFIIVDIYTLFEKICLNGLLDIAKWLFGLNLGIDKCMVNKILNKNIYSTDTLFEIDDGFVMKQMEEWLKEVSLILD